MVRSWLWSGLWLALSCKKAPVAGVPAPPSSPVERSVYQTAEVVPFVDGPCEVGVAVTGREAFVAPDGRPATRAFVKVTDLQGRFVAGLAPPDCGPDCADGRYLRWWQVQMSDACRDESVTVTEVRERVAEPVAVAIVNDFSGSMEEHVSDVIAATRGLLGQVRPEDAVAIVDFDHRIDVDRPLAPGPPSDTSFLDTAFRRHGWWTALYDGAAAGVGELAPATLPRRLALVLTDGYDNASRHSLRTVGEAARAAGVRVDTVGFGHADLDGLGQLAHATGGLSYAGVRPEDIVHIYLDAVRTNLDYYVVEYSCVPDEIEVELVLAERTEACAGAPAVVTNRAREVAVASLDGDAGGGAEGALEPVYFAFDSATPLPDEHEQERLSHIVSRIADVRLTITGHTDTKGGESYNDTLSAERAQAVHDWLVSRGVPEERLIVRSRGEREASADYPDERRAAQNRRVDLAWVPDPQGS